MEVWAPCSGVFMNGRTTGSITRIHRPESSDPKPERTTPGCKTLAVTPEPASRRASSYVNRTLASLDWL